jgi:hypothetical protein
MRRLRSSLALVVLFAAASASVGAPINISGDGVLGDFAGTIEFTSTGVNSGVLKVTLTNSLTTSPGGKITAFAFNNPGNVIASAVEGGTFTANFDVIGGPPVNAADNFQDDIMASPLANFDIGGSISDKWLSGGNPNQGLLIGATGTFEFNLTGAGVGSLTESSFVNEKVDGSHFFIVRFRGFDNGGSDKVSAGDPNGGGNGGGNGSGGGGGSLDAPEPSSVALGLLAAASCVGGYATRRFRRRRA